MLVKFIKNKRENCYEKLLRLEPGTLREREKQRQKKLQFSDDGGAAVVWKQGNHYHCARRSLLCRSFLYNKWKTDKPQEKLQKRSVG